ncbi:MAG: NB-ARC domain-containing protein [Caldilineaceae bacterium]
MPQLQITCLGAFQVLLDDERVTAFPTDKARALLVYLAAEGQAHTRTALAQLLWAGYSEESANNSLRQTLHRLRQLLRDAEAELPWLLITRHTVQINPNAPINVDVSRFTKLIEVCYSHPHTKLARCQPCLERLREAVALYGGDFLAGITIADSDPFEEWRRVVQEQCHVAALDALEQLTDACETNKEYEEAQRFAERQIALEPWREQAHRQLMRVLARSGRRAAALAQYHACRQLLLQELGSEPEALTTSLYEQIRSGDLEEKKPFRQEQQAQEAATPALENIPPEAVPVPQEVPPVALAPATILPNPCHNLPSSLRPLIGRQGMVEQVQSALTRARVVTLTGVGGVGKTTLALQVANALIGKYADGVRLVELARLSDAQFLPATLAVALGVHENAPDRLLDTLVSYLQSKELLLLLDNCEHLLTTTQLLCSQLLANCPRIHILATSRAPLRLREEQVLVVPTLPTPKTLPSITELLSYPAVQLFVARVQAVDPSFRLNEDSAASVLEICQRLDGLPLALELAAARVRLLSVKEIAARLDRRFRLLRAPNARRESTEPNKTNEAARHQTLRATIDWGYELLSESEQAFFRQLAVFAGGFTVAAVEAVVDEDALNLLDALIDRSFVMYEHNLEGSRFYLLESLREYAQEKLDAAGETEEMRQRHLTFFLQLAECAETHFISSTQAEWFSRIDLEVDNLRSALAWALTISNDEGVSALRLAAALGRFWLVRGYIGEAKESLLKVLAHANFEPTCNHPATHWRAKALLWTGVMWHNQNNYVQAKRLLKESLDLFQNLGEAKSIAFTLNLTGTIWDDEGNYDEALRYYEEGYRLFHQQGDGWGSAITLNNRSSIAFVQGDYLRARQLAEEGIVLVRTVGDQRLLAGLLTTLSEAAAMLTDFSTAHQALAEALAIHQSNNDKLRSANVLCSWADMERAQGNYRDARRRYVQSATLAYAIWERRRLAISLEGVANCTAALDDPSNAVRLWSAAATLRTTIGSPLPPSQVTVYETALAAAKNALGNDRFTAAWNAGQSMSLEQAVGEAAALGAAEQEVAAQKDDEMAKDGQVPLATASPHSASSSSDETARHPAHPLPLRLATPLLGRNGELEHLTSLLTRPTTRLVTLVGPPGVGKTRLAREAGAVYSALATDYCFVELSTISDPALVAITIAQALGVRVSDGQKMLETLSELLRDRALLLVLDNFEQVLAAGSTLLRPLLAQCPQLKILVTSRVALHLHGEQIVLVEPLPLPDRFLPMTAQSLRDNPAVQFFCQQAALIQPTFQLTDALAPVVAEICRQLDGLPLALELAAARTRLLPPPALLSRLTNAFQARLQLLMHGSSDLPPRQQTLRAAIAWSYDLLTPQEQRLFCQLAVFVGGCTLEAIEEIATNLENGRMGKQGQASAPPNASFSILYGVESLISKNLLRSRNDPNSLRNGEPRLMMLDTIREFAWEQLTAIDVQEQTDKKQQPPQSDGAYATQQRHADYFLALAERAAPQLHGASQIEWLDRLELENDNLRSAIHWFEQTGAIEKALRMATSLRYFWRVRGYHQEGVSRLEQLLRQPDSQTSEFVRARALNAAGYLQWVQGKIRPAQSMLTEALTLGLAINGPDIVAFAYRYLGLIADAEKDLTLASAHLQESLALYRSIGNTNETALALMYLGDNALARQDDDAAHQLYQESVTFFRQLGNQIVMSYALRHLGYLALRREKTAEAARLCQESLNLNLTVGERQGSAAALVALATVAVRRKQLNIAARLLAVADQWLAASHTKLLPFDQKHYTESLAHIHAQLDEATFRSEQAAGKSSSEGDIGDLVASFVALATEKELHQDERAELSLAVTKQDKPSLHDESSTPASPAALHNLPTPLTPFIGRTRSLPEILNRLHTVRLLTLVGPGGMGKTRLALEVGRQQLHAYADGVWFVSLAAIYNPATLATAIAAELGLTLQGGEPGAVLCQLLHQKRMLLILDNFEHLLGGSSEAVKLVAELLQRAPGVQILVTSREHLQLRGEQIFTVPPLTSSSATRLADAMDSSAVRLFVQSAQFAQVGFKLNAANLPDVLRICHQVQGMPLGLELAAAQVGVLPLKAIADAIEQSTEFLAVDWHDLPQRQRSMRAVFAWSWQLLTSEEQSALRQISIFRGGFDRTAVQAVTGVARPVLNRLLHKSLLQWQETPELGSAHPQSGEERYIMHELLRQFAAEALDASGERAAVEERHGRYYLAYLAARGFRLGRSEPKEASAEIQAELDNVRLAWHWAATQGRLAELDQSVYAWWQFCLLQGTRVEALQSLAAALSGVRAHLDQRTEDAEVHLLGRRLLAKLLALHANHLFAQGHDEEMVAQAREAMQLGAASGGIEGEILGAYVLGRVLQDADQKREAQALWEQCIQLVQHYQSQQPENELLHEVHWMAHILLRGSALYFGDYAGSRAHIVAGLRICQTLGKRHGELTCLSCLAEINFFLYDFAAAEADYRAELALGRSLGYRRSEMSAQEGLARSIRLRGDYATARTLLEESIKIAAELAHHYDEALFLAALIRLQSQLGDQTAAAAGQTRLTQLLAQVKLPKECQLYACLAAAIKAHTAGDKAEALSAAEQANRINQQGGDILFRLVDTALILGHVRAAMGQWETATAAFQEALAAFQQFSNRAVTAEAQAGLAQIALAQGDRASALAQIEALLPALAEEPHAGYNDPFFIYLIGYRVLVANGDPRAAILLQQGYDLLQQDAAMLDEESRQRFLIGVPLHAELVAVYSEMQSQRDKKIAGQGDKETRKQDARKIEDGAQERQTTGLLVAPSALYDWAEMPAVDLFVERQVEVAQLTAWLIPSTGGVSPQLISILGMGGMGKTTLAAVVTKAVAPSFSIVSWRSLLNAPPLSELLRNWLQTLSRQTLTILPDSLDEQLRLLLSYLQQERCLLVLDNVESLFAAELPGESPQSRAGVTRPGYEGYDQLFQRLASSEHQSCLLLTSREQPYALLRSGRQAQLSGRVQMLPLTGLDPQAGVALLQSNGLHTSAAEAAQLVKNYSGNPLALQIVASTIADFFGGDVAAFQREEGALFDGIRIVLDQQFARLSSLERDTLIWLAIEREALSVSTLRSNFMQPVTTPSLLEALQALQNRSLLEKTGDGITLQNVIIEYATEYLVEQVYQELVGSGGWIKDGNANPQPSTLAMSFFNRFALIKAQSKEYVRQSQWRLLVQPLAERLTATLGRAEVTARLPYLLDRLRAAKVRTGYAAGNLLNLLVHLEGSLTNLDCSYLAVWQADLRGVIFAALNLTGADLTNTAFMANIETGKIKFLPSGELLIAGISKGELCLWRTVEGRLTAAFSSTTNSRLPLIFSEDGNWIVVVDLNYKIQLWSTEQGICVQNLSGHHSPIHTLAMSKDGTQLASGSVDGVVNLWEWRNGQCRQQLNGYQLGIGALAFSPNGNTLATGSGDGIIRLWDTRSQATDGRLLTTLQAHNHSVGALAFSPDGRWLASGGHGSNIRLWDLQTEGMPARHLQGHTHMIRNLCFQPASAPSTVVGEPVEPTDAYLLASSSADRTVRLWSLSGELRYTLLGHTDDITALDFSADGCQLVSSGTDQTIYWWDTRTGQMVNSLHAYRYVPTSVVRFSPDGELVVSGSADQLVRLWPVMTDENATPPIESTRCAVLRGHTNFVRAVAVSPSGHIIASGSADHSIRLWDRTIHTELQKLTGHTGAILSLAFTRTDHTGTLLASASGDGSIRLWSINEAKPTVVPRQRVLLGHQGEVLALTFDPIGCTLVSGDINGNVWIWDVESGTTRLRLTGHTAAVTMAAISADGRTLATSAFDQTVRLWDLQTGDCLHVKKDEHVGTRTVVFVPQPGTDDELLAYDGDDFAIYLWPWRTGGPAYPLRGHSSVVLGLDVSPTAPHLVSISRDGTIRIWDTATRTCRQVFHAPGPYTGMKISGVTGISEAQKAALRALGAVED